MPMNSAPYTSSPHLTAEQLLWVAAGQQTIELDRVSLGVVTGTHSPAPDEPQQWLFTVGEILILHTGSDGESRELLGSRSVDLWDTEALSYRTWSTDQAVALSALVRGGAQRGVWEWVVDHWDRSRDQPAAREALSSSGGEPGVAFVGDTDADNTWGMDLAHPGTYQWPAPQPGSGD